jgi:uncharacterized membrane protein YqjE
LTRGLGGAGVNEDLSDTLKRLTTSLLANAQTRFDLLRVELAEERARIGISLYCGAALCFLAFLTLQLVVLAIVACYWDGPYRIHVVVALSCASFAATVAVWATARRYSSRRAEMLAASAEELKKDRSALEAK